MESVMGIRKITKEQLLTKASEQFRCYGYAGTSMKAIADALGINKASLYHHFPSKEALILAVLDAEQARVESEVLAIANTVQPLHERTRQFADAAEKYYLRYDHGCLMANLCAEALGTVPVLAQKLKRYFDAWQQAVVLLRPMDVGNVEQIQSWARDFVAQLQGYVMFYVLFKDKSILRHQMAKLYQY